ncbi:hypothetical protein THAOC_07491 [Thalassiosira oceanica]|uniref:ATP-dependent Clp protease proteolytic subunit n=1 Tax=Thalassiosira oceanica TaxID=159749 RepID=K0T1Q4_THAOC|nr:hypothetical protein THAOC_07491 [Thalassiosira oceanica]|mmetsp:Transcript_26479/g.59347  ORF Transcript_26479/g.59347 Transcript_26479/m.59347 type:complete len:318 (+) Transcript_26479:68-1021(+)|eukprot:EJK71099.1 hypothetical protein THAOC_07491 [Thalassiosira oceanica]
MMNAVDLRFALGALAALLFVGVSPSSAFTVPASGRTTRPSRGSAAAATTRLSVKRMPIMMPTQEPMVPYRAPGSTYDQFVGMKTRQLRDRTLWIARYIDDDATNEIISSLLYLQSEDDKKEIKLYLNIPGANLRPSLAIYDALMDLKASGIKISTTNVALCAGMGALIAGAGTKGMRYSLPNARYLLQKTGMDGVFQGQATDIYLEVKNIKEWNEKINAEISKVTGQPVERIDNDLKRDFYLSSEEAVRYGLIDEVLLPMPNKRQPPNEAVDLGSFVSSEEQKYQGENPPATRQNGEQQNGGMMRNDDDDGPGIAKA